MYSLYVYDEELSRIGMVENVESLQWLSIYGAAGEAKLVCQATEENLRLLKRGRRIWCTEQQECAKITLVEIEDDGKSAKMTIRAPFSASRWNDRVLMGTVSVKNVEAAMLKLVNDNRRGLLGETAGATGLRVESDSEVSWGSVLEAEEALAEKYNLGFIEKFDPVTGKEIFSVYAGTDRTIEGSEDFVGYFGDDIGNISNIQISDAEDEWKNVAIVAGSKEEAKRRVVTASLASYTKDMRRELFVDESDFSLTYQVAIPTGESDKDGNPKYEYEDRQYTTEEYERLLSKKGIEELMQQVKVFEVSAKAEQSFIYYGKDYFLGDILPVKITKYGVRFSARLSAVTTTYETSGQSIVLSLDNLSIL